ncbi:Gp10, partial [Mycolicibacterium canariasense]
MAKYQIPEPCAYAVDGVGVQHTEPGAVVELDAATAEALGQSV